MILERTILFLLLNIVLSIHSCSQVKYSTTTCYPDNITYRNISIEGQDSLAYTSRFILDSINQTFCRDVVITETAPKLIDVINKLSLPFNCPPSVFNVTLFFENESFCSGTYSLKDLKGYHTYYLLDNIIRHSLYIHSKNGIFINVFKDKQGILPSSNVNLYLVDSVYNIRNNPSWLSLTYDHQSISDYWVSIPYADSLYLQAKLSGY